jgi:hypothetical protein
MSEIKIGRNAQCPCGSGQKYKYCCVGKTLRERLLPIYENAVTGNKLSVDMTNDILNWAAQSELPLKNFCKDNEFYFFGLAITVGQCEELDDKLKKGNLTKQEFIEVYKVNCKREFIFQLLDNCCSELEIFNNRKQILMDAFEAHFDGKYTLSIPTLFAQLEGLLREIGNLKNKDNIKPTIPTDIWEKKLLFSVKDDAENFNSFIHKLFEGSASPEKFNRNPILHGFKTDYHNADNSLLILLSILEIRLFKWWDIKVEDFTKRFKITDSE